MAYVFFLLLCGVWGSSFILMKKATVVFDSVTVGLIRVAGGAAVLAIIWWLAHRKQGGLGLPRSARRWVLVPAVLGMAYPFAMQPYLIDRYQDSGFFGMMVCLVPLMTIIARVPLLQTWPTARELIGVLGGLGFVVFLFGDGPSRGLPLAAMLLAVTVPAVYALSNTFVKRTLSQYPPIAVTTSAMAVASFLYIPFFVLQSPGSNTVSTSPPSGSTVALALGSALVLGIVGTGLATWVFFHLVRQRGPLFAGMVTYLVSAVAVSWGFWDGEQVSTRQVAGLVGILAMVAVVQVPWPRRKTADSF